LSIELLAERSLSHTIAAMKKDAPLAFRIPADLKKKLQRLSKQEARSVSQICELLLRIGVEEYDREGHRYLQKVLAHAREDNEA
jgi:predicted DNA-binding protein